jgi:hypothetical protein
MTEKNSSVNYLAILLGILLLILGVFTYRNYIQHKENEAELLNEKLEIQADLDEKIQSLDKAISENTELKDRLTSFKDSLISFKSEVKKLKNLNYASLRKYKNKLMELEKINQELMREAEVLRQQNYALSVEIDSTKAIVSRQEQVITKKQQEADSLIVTTQKMSETIAKGAALKIGGINILAMKRKSSGKLKETTRGKRTNALRIEFTIRENSIAKPGERNVYVVVKKPNGDIIAPGGKFNDSEGRILTYTDTTTVPYENKDKDVVILTEIPKEALDAGTYYVDVFMEEHLQGTGKIVLK